MKEDAGGFVYILASGHYGMLYTGSTTDLIRRVSEHKLELTPGFTKKYDVKRLVWFEAHNSVRDAYDRERKIKKWKRDWKIALIEQNNPHWLDLYPGLASFGAPV
jgi:putative endonuclease